MTWNQTSSRNYGIYGICSRYNDTVYKQETMNTSEQANSKGHDFWSWSLSKVNFFRLFLVWVVLANRE